MNRVDWWISSAEIGARPEGVVAAICCASRARRLNRRVFLGLSADLDWTSPPAVRRHHAPTNQVTAALVVVVVVRVGRVSTVIEPKAVSAKFTPTKSASAEPATTEAAMKAASAKTASMATTTAATSERYTGLNRADRHKYEQGY
jgi:hypothetical protein